MYGYGYPVYPAYGCGYGNENGGSLLWIIIIIFVIFFLFWGNNGCGSGRGGNF